MAAPLNTYACASLGGWHAPCCPHRSAGSAAVLGGTRLVVHPRSGGSAAVRGRTRLVAHPTSGRTAEAALERQLTCPKIEAYLDAGNGGCGFTHPEAADLMARALQFREGVRYTLACWCVMPNHVHVQLQPLPGFALAGIVGAWKSFTVPAINAALGRKGALWGREYYDHLIRNESERERAIAYIRDNPAKAGLRDWKWVYVSGDR
jgi:REP element-mobilizing transposase RayT